MEAVWHGMVLAFGLILPLGVQNIFVFNQGAVHGRLSGALPAVLTASLCDTLLIFTAVGGLSAAFFSVQGLVPVVYAAGMVFLVYMGVNIWRAAPVRADGRKRHWRAQAGYALSVSLLNPHALLDTVGVIGTGSLQYEGADRWMFAAAAAGVSWLWFIGLAVAGYRLGQADPSGRVNAMLNRLSALIIWAIACYMALQLTGL